MIKGLDRIAVLLTSMLKTMVLSVPARPAYTNPNENEPSINSGGNIGGSRIDNRIANLSNFIKKISFRVDFFTPKASLAFT